MNKSEFKKAVADNEAPTPGYLYRDMANWTFVDCATQLQLIRALFDKLQMKNSAFVLYKALHLVKVLCETGQEGFQKELQLSKYTNVVRDFTTYRGPLDSKCGDSWNEKVRCEAQATLEAIFRTRIAGSSSGPAVIGGTGGDWSGTGYSAEDLKAVKSPWGSSGGGEEPVMPSFASLNPYTSGSVSVQQQLSGPSPSFPSSSLPTFDALSMHVGEMPSENKWAAHQQGAFSIGSCCPGGGTTGKPNKTFLQQLASTAKSGMCLMTQFEVLKGKQERLYGDQFGRAARATTGPDTPGGLLDGGQGVDEVGNYQPVSLLVPPRSPDSVVEPRTFTPVPAMPVAAASYSPSTATPSFLEPTLPAEIHEASSFAFASSPSSPAPFTGSVDAAEELIHAFACLKQAPSRVELSSLLHAIEELPTAGHVKGGATPLSSYGVQLASALNQHLRKDKPWQERLNALVSLEAVLRGSAAPLREGVIGFFTRHPDFVQVNYNVVQTSLKEKAAKVAQMLNIPPVPSAAAPVASLMNDTLGNNQDSNSSVPSRVTSEAVNGSGSPRSQFGHPLGGSASPSVFSPNLPFNADTPQTSLLNDTSNTNSCRSCDGGPDTFEGMTVRNAGGGGSSLRRSDTPTAVPRLLVETKTIGLGGDSASRPQRRAMKAATTTGAVGAEAPLGGVPEPSLRDDMRGGNSSLIQVLRDNTSTAGELHQQQRSVNNNAGGSSLDDLLGLSSAAAQTSASPAAPASTTLDDLFGCRPTSGPQSSSYANMSDNNINSNISAGGLFGTAPMTAVPPQPLSLRSVQATAAAHLARIQELMQYLETSYDPVAMRELETLILNRQQELQQMSTQQGIAEGGVVPVARAGSAVEPVAVQPHQRFQSSGARGGQLSERQRANQAFADMQAEMKRKM